MLVGMGAGLPIRYRRWATFLAVVFAVAAALYVVPGKGGVGQTHGAGNLTVNWVADGSRLELIAEGFRPRSSADVKIADQPLTSTRADRTGTIHLEVPVDIVTAGKPGASVILYGKGPTGASRTLFAAVPPRASGRGPIDLLPWSIGAFVVLIIAAALLGRLWQRRRASLAEARRAVTAGGPTGGPTGRPAGGPAGGPVARPGRLALAGEPPSRRPPESRRR
jgi:hypothetical protein